MNNRIQRSEKKQWDVMDLAKTSTKRGNIEIKPAKQDIPNNQL